MPTGRRTAAPLGRWSGLSLLLVAVGYSKSDASQPRPSPAPVGPIASGAPSSPSPSTAQPPSPTQELGTTPPDRSLETDAYIAMGMPAPDRVWTVEDMIKVADVLTTLAAKDPGQLPRFKSPRSGQYFARITSPEDLAQFRDPALSIKVRLPRAVEYSHATNRLLKLYLSHFSKHEVGDEDMVGISTKLLRVTAVMSTLGGEFLPTLDKGDPSYAVRMQGLETVKRGFGGIVIGSLMTLTETDAYRAEARARLLDVMIETFPTIVPWLLPGSRTEMLIRLEKMPADPLLAGLRPGLKELLRKARDAARPTEAGSPHAAPNPRG
jgi:hypothetical protein